MRFHIFLEDTLLDKTRRLNGAINVLDAHVESKRKQLYKHHHKGDKIISGPDSLFVNEAYAETIVLLHDGEISGTWRYAVRENRHCSIHKTHLMTMVCNDWYCGKCYEDTLMTRPVQFAPKLVPLERVYDEMKHMWVERKK